ncbi:MAG TPA: sulfotransferase [Terriglobales bacterium]|nr:sulfotransferase [Terriglobales bacterium]
MDAFRQAIEHPNKRSWIQRISARSRFQKGSAVLAAGDAIDFLPSFFVVGPPRTGISWLYEVLRGRAVLPLATKETRFFDIHFHRGLDWYLAHFPRARAAYPVGEIAPTYFASVEARARIARLIPSARVVCVFRDPVERILSLYRVKRAYGLIPGNFEEAIEEDPEFMDTSRYSENYRAWQNALGPDQVLATLYDDLCDNPQSYLDQLVDFIGVPRFTLTPAQNNCVHASESLTHPRSYARTRNATRLADWLKAQRFDKLVAVIRDSPLRRFLLSGGPPFTELPADLAVRLYERFRPEVEKLERILQRDLVAWKSVGAE